MTAARAQTCAASVIVPAHNEAAYIGACLEAVLGSELNGQLVEVIVVANGCHDATAEIARGYAGRGIDIRVIETTQGGKLHALTLGDEAAQHDLRLYLDADVIVTPGLIAALIDALCGDEPRYASGIPHVAPARSRVTRAYARLWQRLPFMRDGVPGFGLFAMNGAGRARWVAWPPIISDDTFARLHFTPAGRISVPHGYSWPMVEGWRNLVRVRRRQDRGVAEIAARYPALMVNEDKARLGWRGILRLALRDPIGFAVYSSVSLAVRLPGSDDWVRGR